MAWTFTQTAGDIENLVSAKLGTGTVAAGGNLNDNDIGKPVKLLSSGIYGLCADGDNIDGFLSSVDAETQDGYAFGSVQLGGRMYAQLSGAATFGDIVEAAAPAAALTAETSGYGKVSTHAGLAASTVAEAVVLAKAAKWRIISGSVTDGSIVLLEKQ